MDNIHILVVDDNHINRLFFQSVLKKMNYQVTVAENGYQSIKFAKKQKFDLILMDIRMDGMDGVESAKQIKDNSKNTNTPIIAVSAETLTSDQGKNFQASLLKPVNKEELNKTISQFLQNNENFNHQKALDISHQDEDIVSHLRTMFIEQLHQTEKELNQLYNNNDTEHLQSKLHQLLGSAKICAADRLIQCIEDLKFALTNIEPTELAFKQMINEINLIKENSKTK